MWNCKMLTPLFYMLFRWLFFPAAAAVVHFHHMFHPFHFVLFQHVMHNDDDDRHCFYLDWLICFLTDCPHCVHHVCSSTSMARLSETHRRAALQHSPTVCASLPNANIGQNIRNDQKWCMTFAIVPHHFLMICVWHSSAAGNIDWPPVMMATTTTQLCGGRGAGGACKKSCFTYCR